MTNGTTNPDTMTPGTPPVIGVIGGSGVYDIEGLANTRWRKVETPFGAPSDELGLARSNRLEKRAKARPNSIRTASSVFPSSSAICRADFSESL